LPDISEGQPAEVIREAPTAGGETELQPGIGLIAAAQTQ